MSSFRSLLTQIRAASTAPTPTQAPSATLDYTDLLNKLLTTEYSFDGLGRMPLKSALARIFGQVTDISGSRLPALSAANAVLEASQAAQEARLAAEETATSLQALKDAAQDAEAVLNALNDSSLAATVSAVSGLVSDLSGNVRGRLAQLEAIPAYNDAALVAALADLSGSVMTRFGTVEGSISTVSAEVATKLATSVHESYISTTAIVLSGLDSRIGVAESALPTKVAQADYDVYVAANNSAVAGLDSRVTGAEGSIGGVDARLAAVESSVPTKVAQADYDVYVSGNDAAVAGLDSRVTGAEASIGGLDGRLATVEAELPNKALASDVSALDGRVVSIEGNYAGKLLVESAADYAAAIALGATGIAKVSASPFALDANAATNTILHILAAADLTLTVNGSTVYEMLEGESVTAAKNSNEWVIVPGIVPLSAAPAYVAPPPMYPAAWASLPSGGYTVTRRSSTPEETWANGADVAEISPALDMSVTYAWFEYPSGKIGAGSYSGSLFISLDANAYPLANATAFLISVGGVDASDAGVTYRIAL